MAMLVTAPERGNRECNRPAFTLVELLVSLALIVFIMSILSSGFATASKTFTDLKAAGDHAENLRGVMTLLRRDLAAPHFKGNTQLLVSQVTQPQGEGFFRIFQGNNPAIQTGPNLPGTGSDVPAFINTQAMLHFTAILPGNMPADFFSTDVVTPGGALFDPRFLRNQGYPPPIDPGYTTTQNQDNRYQPSAGNASSSILKSKFGEVAWWLSPSIGPDGNNATTTAGTNSDGTTQVSQPLFTLRRRQRVVWSEGPASVPWPPSPPIALPQPTTLPSITMKSPDYDELSAPAVSANTSVQINGMSQVTMPAFRFGMDVGRLPGTTPYVPPGTTAPPPYVLPTTTTRNYAGVFPAAANNNYPSPVAVGRRVPTNPGRIDDIVIDNVLSFDVQVLIRGMTNFVHLSDNTATSGVQSYTNRNPAFPTATGPWVYDTWSDQALPFSRYSYSSWQAGGTFASIPLWRNASNLNISIQAIQVTLRLWDFKSQSTRQVSMIQAM